MKIDYLIDVAETYQMMSQIADQMVGRKSVHALKQTAIIGIQKWGVFPAKVIAKMICDRVGVNIPVGTLDIAMYRDDIGLGRLPKTRETNIPFLIDDIHVVIVDDVLHKGRTIRAALDALTDYGRPATIELAVLLDRGGRQLPIQPDYVAKTMMDLKEEQWLKISILPEDMI